MSDHHDEHGIGHVAPLRALVMTAVALLFLTWLTVAVVEVDLGAANIYVALGIAVVKGAFVALYFMHLRWDRSVNSIIFIGSLAAVGLFIGIAMTDTSEYKPDQDAYRDAELIQKDGDLRGDAKAVQAKIAESAG